MTITRIDAGALDGPAPGGDLAGESAARHPTAVGGRLDAYLGRVVDALREHGVLAGAPQRTDATHRLAGTVVLDCTAVRLAAWHRAARSNPERQSLGGAVHPARPSPVSALWDEQEGWCVELDGDPARPSRCFLHPDLLPDAQTVADFVVGLALGRTLGAAHPVGSPPPGRPHLRLVR
ncbi:hypothetical protein [Pseudonocardia abyssalis]|uniref:Uncharacterized protein n=1 Tax=Pseudonocardia abyssalis TaxID=2792008 RepID=A0ABS6ULD7_9PSEU|nr:hypothetical protein [Pseudonocardia abyssalis]MBW0117172.1 hypothetical protein [Pseudonocardia abyssalis]MBW0133069.1 hypothetical protein [Pseudonocardia abyssalis]